MGIYYMVFSVEVQGRYKGSLYDLYGSFFIVFSLWFCVWHIVYGLNWRSRVVITRQYLYVNHLQAL